MWERLSRSILLLFDSDWSVGNPHFFIFYLEVNVEHFLLHWVGNFLLSWNLCGRTLHVGLNVGSAVSLTFDCFSIQTRVLGKKNIIFFDLFSDCFSNSIIVENSVSKLVILNSMWQRLSRSLLTAFLFWLELWKTIFQLLFDFLFPHFLFIFCKSLRYFWYWSYSGSGYLAQIWLLLDCDSSFGNPFL